jgi:demethylmenaquinone methyltransferase/2-methoxy-6-polyprenyl-1,4-benzoquinol methylase
MSDRSPAALEALMSEQVAYYRAVSGEYEEHAIPGAWGGELEAAVERFAPTGAVLELACGTGLWTGGLVRHADSLTAVDGAAEMLAIASGRVRDPRVRFVEADIFSWVPDRRYDAVFFGFWLSHVPRERFAGFWSLVGEALAPGGRVMFVDDAHRTEPELVYGASSDVVRRELTDGSRFRVVKVPHTPAELERRLAALGWAIEVTPASSLFFWGVGAPA